eukprot:Pgem_evm1s18540
MKQIGGYDWADLLELIQQVDNKCTHCELTRYNIRKYGYHPLKSITADYPGDKWVVDLIILPKDETKTLLHIVDVFSAKTVAIEIHKIMCEHGYPRMMIHDKGNEFINSIAKEMFGKLANILTTGGSPYHPQTQGSNEVRHKQIRNHMIELLNTYETSWIDAVPTVEMKINLTITRKHGSTPFAVYYGRTHNIFNPISENKTDIKSWFERLDEIEKIIYPELKNKINNYIIGRFFPGDWVKIKVTPEKSLAYKWKGPYIIKERVQGGYDIVDINSSTGEKVNEYPVPIDQLLVWGRMDAVNNNDKTYDFKAIINHKYDDSGRIKYLVKWCDDSLSWEESTQFPDKS